MSRGANLLHAIYGTCWAMSEPRLHAMLAFLDEYAAGAKFTADEIRARVGEPRTRGRVPEGSAVVVLPVYGLISHRAHMVQNISGPGGTSTELLGRDFDEALADPKVGTIVLDVDSPGGSVSGVQELAEKIRAGRSEKRIIAVANSLAASAAYWIASAAEELVVTPSGEVGAIGVYAIHTDASQRDRNIGLTRTILKAGKHKAEGHPFGPLDDDAREYALSQINEYYDAFTAGVSASRNVSLETARGEKFGEGRTVTARQAVARGMADRVGTLEQVLAELGIDGGTKTTPMREKRRGEHLHDALGQLPAPALAAGETGTVTIPSSQSLVAFDDPRLLALWEDALRQIAADAPRPIRLEARQGADEPPAVSLASPAPQAKEHPVSDTTTAAPPTPGATNEVAAMRAEMDRQAQIRGLASLVPGVTLAEVEQLISSNATVEQARAAFQAKVGTPQPVQVRVGADRDADRPFATVGEQLAAIVQAGIPGGRRDARLQRYAAVSGMNEGVGSEGGYFLDANIVDGVLEPMYAEDPLLSRVTEVPVAEGRNDVSYQVVDETSRATGSRWGGLQMYWVGEGDTATPKKPKTRKFTLPLGKLMGLAYITEELKQDAPAASTLLNNAYAAETRFMLCEGIWRGIGGGQPIGWLNAGATVSVAIEAGQTIANTPASIAINTSKMLARIPADLWNQAVFFYNPELFPYIATATLGGSSIPVFVQGGTIAGAPPSTIWGRPAFASEFCEAVGTPGDIVCVVPGEYHTCVKEKGATVSSSSHVRFVYDEDTLKITQRFGGATPWKAAVTPFKGAATRSPFVTLAARA